MVDQTKARSDRDDSDMAYLMTLPSFKRFLFRVIESSGIHSSAYGSDERRLSAVEGRRSLGFDMLRWADEGSRMGNGDGMASLLLILHEASASTPVQPETRNARQSRRSHDRNDELLGDDDVDDGDPVRS